MTPGGGSATEKVFADVEIQESLTAKVETKFYKFGNSNAPMLAIEFHTCGNEQLSLAEDTTATFALKKIGDNPLYVLHGDSYESWFKFKTIKAEGENAGSSEKQLKTLNFCNKIEEY